MIQKSKFLKSNVVKNFSYVTIGNILAQLLNLLALIKISKIFTQENYGTYTFLTVQGFLIFTLADLGIRNIIIRTIARDNSSTKSIIYNGLLIRLCSVIIFSLLYYFYNLMLGHLSLWNVILVSFFALCSCITNLFESTFWGLQKMLTPAITNVLTSLLWFIIIFYLPIASITIGLLYLIYIVINIILTGIVYFIILTFNKSINGKKRPFIESSAALLKQSWPYFVLVLLTIPYSYLTNNFLDINSNKVQIGFFNLTTKLLSPITLVLSFSLSALFPNLSNLWVRDVNKFRIVITQGVRIFILSALTLCLIYSMFGELIIKMLFSIKYLQVIKISKIHIWFIFLMSINSLIGTIWGATNNEKLLIKSSLINIAIAGPLLYFGSFYGALGLSYSYVLAFSIFEIYLWLSFKKSIGLIIKKDGLLWLGVFSTAVFSFYFLDMIPNIVKFLIFIIMIILVIIYLRRKNLFT